MSASVRPVIPDRRARFALGATLIWIGAVAAACLAADSAPGHPGAPAEPTAPAVPTAVRPQVPATPGLRVGVADTSGARPGTGPGEALDGLRISGIDLRPLNIYDPIPPGRLAVLYRLADRMHIRTREHTLESQLLFGRGDRWSAARGREQGRNLRSLDFLTPVSITPRRSGDSVRVEVVTRDLWTTSPEFNFESSGGNKYGAVAFTEKNLLGFGKSLSFSLRHDPVGQSRALSYYDPNVGGSRTGLSLVGERGGGGGASHLMLGVPFWALAAPRTYGVSYDHATSTPVIYSTGSEVANFDQRIDDARMWWGHGSYRDSIVRRYTYSIHVRDRLLGPLHATTARPIPPEFIGGTDRLRLNRFETEARWWRPQYQERVGVDQMGVIEDFDLGTSVTLDAGIAPGVFGGDAEGYVGAAVAQGVNTGLGFGWAEGSVHSRMRNTPRELVERIDAHWVHQSLGRQTLVLAAHGIAGFQMDRDFQVVVGGLNGLRAYAVQATEGRRLWRLNAEDRWRFGDLFGGLFTTGAVVFTDAARAWGPGAGGSPWFVDSGFGLRFTAPQWTLGRVVRLDLAWPVTPTRDGKRQPVFSFGSSQAF